MPNDQILIEVAGPMGDYIKQSKMLHLQKEKDEQKNQLEMSRRGGAKSIFGRLFQRKWLIRGSKMANSELDEEMESILPTLKGIEIPANALILPKTVKNIVQISVGERHLIILGEVTFEHLDLKTRMTTFSQMEEDKRLGSLAHQQDKFVLYGIGDNSWG